MLYLNWMHCVYDVDTLDDEAYRQDIGVYFYVLSLSSSIMANAIQIFSHRNRPDYIVNTLADDKLGLNRYRDIVLPVSEPNGKSNSIIKYIFIIIYTRRINSSRLESTPCIYDRTFFVKCTYLR